MKEGGEKRMKDTLKGRKESGGEGERRECDGEKKKTEEEEKV